MITILYGYELTFEEKAEGFRVLAMIPRFEKIKYVFFELEEGKLKLCSAWSGQQKLYRAAINNISHCGKVMYTNLHSCQRWKLYLPGDNDTVAAELYTKFMQEQIDAEHDKRDYWIQAWKDALEKIKREDCFNVRM